MIEIGSTIAFNTSFQSHEVILGYALMLYEVGWTFTPTQHEDIVVLRFTGHNPHAN